ncbi:alpha/beta fold hydrolase [Cellulophaga sp. L1A9]|uniref:alpha/beta fold hydrolase n=1 Tax=Cellulophaga sp. L1A9 TaxID=2686362 RepID=UPI00131CE906|nr:alpha/beta hydrolase [Cellulophaga sp. L1A9]
MKFSSYLIGTLSLLIISCHELPTDTKEDTVKEVSFFLPPPTTYNTIEVNGVDLFYREAGDPKKPTILLLHGYPSSSHSYRNLIPMLASQYHIIAPDNLGSGYSDHPNLETTNYTFDLLAEYTNELLSALKIDHYTLYMQDFGAPVGYRMMMKDPKRIDALIVQNANAYLDGLIPARQAFFKKAQEDTSQEELDFLYHITSEKVIINKQYLFDLDTTNYNTQSPDAWTHDLSFLQSQADRMIQVQLFQDYYTNLLAYPTWQKMLKETQPKTLIVWGAKDVKFNADGAKAYLRDLPNAELHLLDAGHFAVEEKPRDIALLILNFLE